MRKMSAFNPVINKQNHEYSIGGRSRALRNDSFCLFVKIDKNIEGISFYLPKGVDLISVNSSERPRKIDIKSRKYYIAQDKIENPSLLLIRVKMTLEIELTTKIIFKFELFEKTSNSKKKIHILNHTIEIYIPKVEIKIKKNQNLPQNGFIQIEFITEEIFISINKIDIQVYQHNTEKQIHIEKRQMEIEEYFQIIDKLPPEVNPDTYIGDLKINQNLDVDVMIVAEFNDLKNNKFLIESNKIHIPKSMINDFICNPLMIPTISAN